MKSRRAKIVATLGPSSSDVPSIQKLIHGGVDIARLNMSHGDHDDHLKRIQAIREACDLEGRHIGILMDLQGPKIRVGKLKQALELKDGEKWLLGPEDEGKNKEKFIPTTYQNLVTDAEEGCQILFDDGLMEAKVLKKKKNVLEIEIITGGALKSNKGINLPTIDVSAPSLTEKDEKDLIFGLEQNVDFFALSFVRTEDDILKVKYKIHKLKVDTPIIAKIEKPEAIENIEKISDAADGIMIARGDMAVEIGNHLVPAVQKRIITLCNQKGVPVITATQMLESMHENPRPTRAEASDVANAIWDGTDAVMLSGETASGEYPLEAVLMMDAIVKEAEKDPKERPFLRNMDLSGVSSAIQVSASLISEKIYANWIVVLTQTGSSCLHLARFRPRSRVLGITNSTRVARKMNLYWGTTPMMIDKEMVHIEEFEEHVMKELKKQKMIQDGDKVVISRGDGKVFNQLNTNSIRVEIVNRLKEEKDNDYEEVELEGGKILFNKSACASCQKCLTVCPHSIWKVSDDEKRGTYIDKNRVSECTFDQQCQERCPTGAIEIMPKIF